MGIQTVINDFKESFRVNNPGIVKDTPVLPPERVRIALSTGVFIDGGQEYLCQQNVDEATIMFLNRFADMYQRLLVAFSPNRNGDLSGFLGISVVEMVSGVVMISEIKAHNPTN